MRRLKIDPRFHIEKLSDILDLPEVIRVNKFDEDALEDFEEEMESAHRTGQPVIPIMIDSYGGSAYGILGMIACVENAEVPVATILTSKAMSAGAILFCFGTEGYRYMHPEAWIMIHDVGGGTGGKVEDVKADTNQMDILNKRMYKRVSRQLGHQKNYIPDLIKQNHHVDWYLTAKEAKKHNIANHLHVPKFEIEIGLNVSFG